MKFFEKEYPMIACKKTYLADLAASLMKIWPDNESITIACHGHSIPCGYMAENTTRPFDAYPHLFHARLAERFPHSVINVTVTAIGGENSLSGAARFERDVLIHHPRLITIDYGRNDMFLTEAQMRRAWTDMTQKAMERDCKVLLITPAPDCGGIYYDEAARKLSDEDMAGIIREVAEECGAALADVHGRFAEYFAMGHQRSEYAVSVNHLNRQGHEIIADALMEWVPYL